MELHPILLVPRCLAPGERGVKLGAQGALGSEDEGDGKETYLDRETARIPSPTAAPRRQTQPWLLVR